MKTLPTRRTFLGVGAALAGGGLLAAAPPAAAETLAEAKLRLDRMRPKDFPSKPVEVVVPYAVAGGMDIVARMMVNTIQKYTEAPFFVNNRTGAGGLIGNTWLATRAPNDGHAMGVVANGLWSDAFLRAEGKWKFDSVESVGFISSDPTYWITSTAGPYATKTLKEVIDESKASPGKISLGTVLDILPDFLVDKVELTSGGKFLRVPINGSGAGMPLLLGGNLDISIGYPADFQGYVDGGRMRVLGVASASRMPKFPQVPTFNEALGRDDVLNQAWRFVVIPRGMPEDRRAWVVAVLQAALTDPGLNAELERLGGDVRRDRLTTPRDVQAEVSKLAQLERNLFVQSGRLKE